MKYFHDIFLISKYFHHSLIVLAGILVAMTHGRHVQESVMHTVLRRRHRTLVGRNAATRTLLKQNV
jgi:hypothetical protein